MRTGAIVLTDRGVPIRDLVPEELQWNLRLLERSLRRIEDPWLASQMRGIYQSFVEERTAQASWVTLGAPNDGELWSPEERAVLDAARSRGEAVLSVTGRFAYSMAEKYGLWERRPKPEPVVFPRLPDGQPSGFPYPEIPCPSLWCGISCLILDSRHDPVNGGVGPRNAVEIEWRVAGGLRIAEVATSEMLSMPENWGGDSLTLTRYRSHLIEAPDVPPVLTVSVEHESWEGGDQRTLDCEESPFEPVGAFARTLLRLGGEKFTDEERDALSFLKRLADLFRGWRWTE